MTAGTSRARILQVVGGLNVGGTETWLVKGFPKLRDCEYDFDFLVHGDDPQHYAAELEAHGARVLRCPTPRDLVAYVAALYALIRRNRYRAVHAHTYCFSGIVLTIAALAGVPVRVFQSHTAQDESQAAPVRRAYFRVARWLIRTFATRSVAVSEEAARAFFPASWREHPERWSIAPVGIDLSPFQCGRGRELVRSELDIPTASTVAIHVGRFVPVKNHELLVEVARRLVTRDSNWIFVLVGDGPGRKAIADRVKAFGISEQFRFTGLRSDVARLLTAADVFLLPSLYEGFPLAYLEAQAAGLPCVISTAIAPAADLVPGRTWRRSLKEPPDLWAETLLQASVTVRQPGIPPQMQAVSLEHSMERLLECYR